MNDLFESIKSTRCELSEEELKTTIAGIVDVLRERHITYDCAFRVLYLAIHTLEEMSKALTI